MGVVYGALPSAAVKILNARRAALQPDLVRRFEIEAEAVSRLTSPHIAAVLGSGTTEEGHLYIAMELLRGDSLDQILERTPRLTPAASVSIAYQAAHALSEAHDKRIIHRDLKPANLFVEFGPGGTNLIRVLDFGIARINSGSIARSRTGTIAGSPPYMSPEQLRGLADIDGRSDIYSLGVVLYQLLSGNNPFHCEAGVVATLRRHLEFEPPALPPNVPRPLADLVREMLAKERQARIASMHQVCARLEAIGLLDFDTPTTVFDRERLRDDEDDLTEVEHWRDGLTPAVMDIVQSQPDLMESSDRPDTPDTADPAGRSFDAQFAWVIGVSMSLGVLALTLWLSLRGPSAAEVPVSKEPEHVPVAARPFDGSVQSPPAPTPARLDADHPDAGHLDAGRPDAAAPSASERPPRRARARQKPDRAPRRRGSSIHQRRLDTMLSHGDRAMTNQAYDEALGHYREWLALVREVDPDNAALEVIKSRVTYLEDVDWRPTDDE